MEGGAQMWFREGVEALLLKPILRVTLAETVTHSRDFA